MIRRSLLLALAALAFENCRAADSAPYQPHVKLAGDMRITCETSAEPLMKIWVERFAKLQRKYGRWGLAYLESLLRAADYAASSSPSKVQP